MQKCRRSGFLGRKMKKKGLYTSDKVQCDGECIKSMDTSLWQHIFASLHFAQYAVTLYGIVSLAGMYYAR